MASLKSKLGLGTPRLYLDNEVEASGAASPSTRGSAQLIVQHRQLDSRFGKDFPRFKYCRWNNARTHRVHGSNLEGPYWLNVDENADSSCTKNMPLLCFM